MDDDRDGYDYPIIMGQGSASTLHEYSTPQPVKKMRRIGFKFPKRRKASPTSPR